MIGSGCHGPVRHREQRVPSRHPRAGVLLNTSKIFFENHSTGPENPWEPVQVLLPLESEVTLGSGHWGALWDRLPCLKKGEGPNIIQIWLTMLTILAILTILIMLTVLIFIDCRHASRGLSSNNVEEALFDELS